MLLIVYRNVFLKTADAPLALFPLFVFALLWSDFDPQVFPFLHAVGCGPASIRLLGYTASRDLAYLRRKNAAWIFAFSV